MPVTDRTQIMDKVVALCKRRGFIFQSSEIYGGLNSCWDYGPLGIELKNTLSRFWWDEMTLFHDSIVGLDAAILMHPRVWEASGHVAGFSDPLVDCKTCKSRFRFDQLPTDETTAAVRKWKLPNGDKGETAQRADRKYCPTCGSSDLSDIRQFNLMFKTFMGPVEESASVIYLRPETAQGIYVNALTIAETMRLRPPFGIAQIGKAFRNEITPGNFIFRTREFEQMEMQYFVKPGEDMTWFEFWKAERMKYCQHVLQLTPERLRFHQHEEGELAHYAKAAFDIEYEFPFGWSELEGVHNRTDFDLSRHSEFSGKAQTIFDEGTKERYIPYIIETSAGLTRSLLAVLTDSYDEDEQEGDLRVVMRFKPHLAPVKAGIFPLMKKDGLPEMADALYRKLQRKWKVFYDQSGSIGKRYRRMDEIGTPYCITVDYDSKDDQAATIRDRDSLQQVRVALDKIPEWLEERVTLQS
ncbi:MAG: glycine--tRNA ligase [bacterium]|nr:glycine--tRNA ligase [bacterium]